MTLIDAAVLLAVLAVSYAGLIFICVRLENIDSTSGSSSDKPTNSAGRQPTTTGGEPVISSENP